MNPSFWSRFVAGLGALASLLALAGSFVALAWLAVRLERTPEVWLNPWAGSAGGTPLVVVDAGHGGHDGGAVANGLVEKDVALDLAKALRHQLELRGIRLKMLRQKDVFLPLEERSSGTNEAEAAAFVSLHLNTSVAAPEVAGIETYFTRRKSLAARRPAADAHFLQDDRGEWLARSIQQNACRMGKAENRGVKEKSYAVVTHTVCPAVLVECGFLTNAAEAARLKQQDYRDHLTAGIAQGVAEFLKTQAVNSQRGIQPMPSTLAPTAVAAAVEEP
ncbi:MAG: N-acetylmuramoyl-L-alanine amidase [Prosthecobacter sp.]|nr:N-acetylmuramoyl-L-alanine amidase [Prosthecobacter sp.]